MSDDSFIREVNEEFRQDQAKALWNRFAPIIIAAAVIIVLGVAGWRGYEYWVNSRADASGDRFSQALALGEQGKPDEALAALEALEADGHGSYPVLARMRASTGYEPCPSASSASSAASASSGLPCSPSASACEKRSPEASARLFTQYS